MGLSRILFDNRLKDAAPAASSTAAGNYNVLNLRGARPYTWWRPATVPAYVDVDSGRTALSDCIAIIGHDLGSARGEVALFASDSAFGATPALSTAAWRIAQNLITSPEVIGAGVSGWSEFNDADVDVQRLWVAPPDMPTVRAHKVFCRSTGAVQRQIVAAPALADNTIYCASALLQAAEVPAVALTWASKAGNFPQVLFNLQTGAFVSATSSGGESAVAYGIESRGGGWYRVWGAFDSKSGVATPGANWILRTAAGANYSGAVGDGLLFAAPKIEVGSAPTAYIPQSNPPIFATMPRTAGRYRRLHVTGASAPSLAAVMFGQAMTLPCGLEAPFDPRGRKVDGRKVNNDNGQPLGSFVDYEKWEASIRLRAIPWSWVRSTWEPAWNAALRSEPFVFCWEPDAYGSEARLVTTDGEWDAPHSPGSLCDLSFKLKGSA